jgi:glycosyltransferase involved in cell wall biosynthesis
VLPHPGGGGETYVDLLSAMDGYRFERVYLARGPDPHGAWRELAVGIVRAHRAARSHDIVHVHGEVASVLMLPALAAKPSVVTTHGLHLLRRMTGLRRLMARAALAAIVRAASRTICTSQEEYDEILTAAGAWTGERMTVIRNGVAIPDAVSTDERIRARLELRLGSSVIAAAWIGSLDARKDPLTPLRAAQALRADGIPFALVIAGDGPLRRAVDEVSARADGARVLGFCDDVRMILAAADVFVISSAREGLAFAVLEAMAFGLPIVATDAPGNTSLLDGCALFAPFGDVAGFAAAFRRLADQEAERTRLGAAARDRVRVAYRLDEMVERTRAIYGGAIDHERLRTRGRGLSA